MTTLCQNPDLDPLASRELCLPPAPTSPEWEDLADALLAPLRATGEVDEWAITPRTVLQEHDGAIHEQNCPNVSAEQPAAAAIQDVVPVRDLMGYIWFPECCAHPQYLLMEQRIPSRLLEAAEAVLDHRFQWKQLRKQLADPEVALGVWWPSWVGAGSAPRRSLVLLSAELGSR